MAARDVSAMTAYLCLRAALMLLIADAIVAQGTGRYIPEFVDYSALDNKYLREDLPLGYSLGQIQAVDRDNTSITYSIRDNGAEFFFIDPRNGSCYLKKKLDFEILIEIKTTIFIVDGNGQSNSVQVKLFIIDVNDNAPVFADNAIFRNVSESTPPGTIIAFISVSDLDTVNAQITVICTGNTTLYIDACNKFHLNVTDRTNKYWRGYLVLSSALDYETRISYNIRLEARDGYFIVTTEVHIEVIDENDAPPIIYYISPKTCPEENPIGTAIFTVTAVDGDLTNSRSIRYTLCGDNTDIFSIDSVSGVVSNKARLDYDATGFRKGIAYEVCISACEIIDNATGQVGNDSTTCAISTVMVTVTDENDNGPEFSQAQFTAFIDENTVSGANVPGLEMLVTDIDSGTFNSFDLEILNYTDVFGILPTSDAAVSSATIYVKNGTKIDYEKGPRIYIITAVARQNFNSDRNPTFRSSFTTITIYVRDVNDITPTFDSAYYNGTVFETAPPGTIIIQVIATDIEEGNFGTAGIIYRLYGDFTPPHFQINEITGVVTVAPCDTPGLAPCIDYERKREYTLTVSATDNKGRPIFRTRSVMLYISVIDENDNIPIIDSYYVRYIYEGQTVTINQLKIEPVDPDSVGGPLSFIIIGDGTRLWQVTRVQDNNTGAVYGNITAVRPILFSDGFNNTGQFNFLIQVSDVTYSTQSTVQIIVIDVNDHAPVCSPSTYRTPIRESTKGNVYIASLTASDGDSPSTGNGLVDFSISSGAQGKFYISNVTYNGREFICDVYTTKDAVFNYETQNSYSMSITVRDRGSQQSLFTICSLTVVILDVNNKNPTVTPTFQSVNVYENEPNGTKVYTLIAEDPDINSCLNYFITAIQAISGSGENVNMSVYDFSILFRAEKETGDIIVNSTLSRAKTQTITYVVTVFDMCADPVQTGNGTLMIRILEYNNIPPRFEYTPKIINIDEEMNLNSFVVNLNCVDDNNKIAGYSLMQTNPTRPTYFALLPGSGAVIMSDRIDYEQIESIELTAYCTDSGDPSLSASQPIIVNINNVNDNTPIFDQGSYRTSVTENTVNTTLNISCRAYDMDKGDYGVVRYALDDPNHFFAINPITCEITILPNATIDREKASFLTLQVIAYDSPANDTVRRRSTVPVYITIDDLNDNCPVFSLLIFTGKVPESANIGTDIIDIIATDKDSGINGQIVFAIKTGTGDPREAEDLFAINRDNGRISVNANLKGKIRSYSFNITATDMRGEYPGIQCQSTAIVQIEVQQSDNNAPEWIRPPTQNYVIYVLESQYDGMLVYDAKAVDIDVGPNGVINYFFYIENNQLVSATAEFRINRVTGVIRAEIVFDRERVDRYFLSLMARDNGNPPSSSEITLVVLITDVNDNSPQFAMEDGSVTPLILPAVREGQTIPSGGLYVGSCLATDADSDAANNRIYYELITGGNDVQNIIRVDRNTCAIYLLVLLDYEATPYIYFEILAYNEKNDDTVKRVKREANPSVLPVTLPVIDTNDNPPLFTLSEYRACVSSDAPFQQNILQVKAADRDQGDNSRIMYSLTGTQAFQIDSYLGIISNIISFLDSSDSQQIYRFYAVASDGTSSSSASVTIFVTMNSNIVRLKVNQPLNDVLPFKQQLVNTLVGSSNGNIVFACVTDMRNHMDANGQISLLATDVLISAFRSDNGQYVPYSASELVEYVKNGMQKDNSGFDAIYVTNAKEEGKDDEFILKEDAVLAVFIICILLIFLALLLICIACICIRNSDRKKKKNIKAASHSIVHVHQELETSINPVYDVDHPESESVEYSTIKKVHPNPTPISPVVVPAPLLVGSPVEYVPVEPPRSYLDQPEPVIETFVEPEPVIETFVEPEPVIVTYLEPEPVIETYLEPEPVIEADVGPEPVIETILEPELVPESSRRFRPEFENWVESGMDGERKVIQRTSFPDPIEEDDDIEASIRDSPPPSPPSSFIRRHPEADYDSD